MFSRDRLRVRSPGYSVPAHFPNLDVLLYMVIGTHWYTDVHLLSCINKLKQVDVVLLLKTRRHAAS